MVDVILVCSTVIIALLAPIFTDIILTIINNKISGGHVSMKNVELIVELIKEDLNDYDMFYAKEFINKLSLNELQELLDNEMIVTSEVCKEITNDKDLTKVADKLYIVFETAYGVYQKLNYKSLMRGVF